MIKLKKEIFIFGIFMFFISLNSVYAQQSQKGCCTNPGAYVPDICFPDTLIDIDSCCPLPESSNQAYYTTQSGPTTYSECIQQFFFSGKGCSEISACSGVGCCCSPSPFGGSIRKELECKNLGQKFYSDITDSQQCSQKCTIPQCRDGIDNNNNGCTDSDDTACTSPEIQIENGNCKTQPVKCNDPAYKPKLTDLIITPVKGQRKFLLRWKDECTPKSYDIFRCKGPSCTNFENVATASTNSFDDSSDQLLYDSTSTAPYTYKIIVQYTNGQSSNQITKTANLGNLECFGQLTADPFCIFSGYYDRYKDYLISNFVSEFTDKDFSIQIAGKFGSKFNSAYHCDELNKLVGPSLSCNRDTQVCVIDNKQPFCTIKIDCRKNDVNPFGIFFTKEDCEKYSDGKFKPCFYDRSHTIVNSCFNCAASMSCYDYKSEDACASDHCNIANKQCKWKNLEGQIGIGVCINPNEYNCQWCDKEGTLTLDNVRSFNEVFDLCTKDKSDLLSEGNFNCYFNNVQSKSCDEVVCTDYAKEECSNNQITHNQNNIIINPSNDRCRIKICQNIGNKCAKNSDGDNAADCDNRECENDYFPPNTTITSIPNRKGIYEELNIVISDKINAKGATFDPASTNYITFLCVEPFCNDNGHPYLNKTRSRKIILSNLDAFDQITGFRVMSLKEGLNTIRFYSQDPSKNIGEVKKITIESHSNTSGPKVFAVNITGSQEILGKIGKIYTSNTAPRIDVEFFDSAIITSAKLTNTKTGSIVNPQLPTSPGKINQLPIVQTLANGEYLLELNAKNQNSIFMDPIFTKTIVIDNKNPTLTFIPSNGTTVNETSRVLVALSFDEEVKLETVTINSQDIKNLLSSTDNKNFTGIINMQDGNKKLEVTAKDYARNPVSSFINFVVDSSSLVITLLNPRFGVSSTQTFDILAETDNNAECRYSLDSAFLFENMKAFTITGATKHNITNFNSVQSSATRTLFIRCKESKGTITLKSFILSVDTTNPQIKKAFAFPNPIADEPPVTTLTVEADEPALCKFTADPGKSFADMEGKFDGFDQNNFVLINRQEISIQGETEKTVYVACKNKAELVSDIKSIHFTVDLSVQLNITSTTPDAFGTTNIVLSLGTNKKAQCTYSNNPTITGDQFGLEGYNHRKDLTLSGGRYTYYIECRDASGASARTTINFTIDVTAPLMRFVNDTSTFEENQPIKFKDKTCLNNVLRVKFLAQDAESGIIKYFYSLFKGTQPIIDLVEALGDAGNQWILINQKPDGSPLNLEDNTRYFFSVNARNYVGLNSTPQSSDGIIVDTSLCQTPQDACGNGRLDTGEVCDPDDTQPVFGSINKCTFYSNYIGGKLKCTAKTATVPCFFDTSDCIPAISCKNGVIEPGEQCEWRSSSQFMFGKVRTCADLGFASNQGQLKCGANCLLDTSNCVPKAKCGNGIIDSGEECDGINLGPLNGQCTNYSSTSVFTVFTGGDLRCVNCRIDTSSCSGLSGNCDGSVINIGEKCDGTKFGTTISDCKSYSEFINGIIKCANNCQLDTSECVPKEKCPNNLIDPGETCDSNNFGILSTSCSEYSAFFSGGVLSCNSECSLNTTQCVPAEHCGNGIKDDGEQCDGTDFGSTLIGTCINMSKLQFIGGNLKCNPQGVPGACEINFTDCISLKVCGDNRRDIENNEQCDGSDFGSYTGTCTNYSQSYIGGNLICNPSSKAGKCIINTTQCQVPSQLEPRCGNNQIDQFNESCDGTDLGFSTCQSLGYQNGNIGCNTTSCRYILTGCSNPLPKYCGNGVVEKPNDANFIEKCDSSDLDGKTCSSFQGYSGTGLACRDDCRFDLTKCTVQPPGQTCGNNVVDQFNESCDGTDLGFSTCQSLGYQNGNIGCNTTSCRYILTGCSNPLVTYCGDHNTQKPNSVGFMEQCDKPDLDGKTCSSFEGFLGLGLDCANDCRFDKSKCTIISDTPVCGDGVVGRGEQCDGNNLDNKNCQSFGYSGGNLFCISGACQFNLTQCILPPHCGNGRVDADKSELCDDHGPVFLEGLNSCKFYTSFIGGNLSCNNCDLDTTNCVRQPYCGDGKLDPGEKCEIKGNIFGAANSCDDLGFLPNQGQLRCAPNCFLDTTRCIPKPKCGNGIIDSGEECDGINLGPLNGQCTNYASSFTGGTLTCSSNCKIDTSNCQGIPGGSCNDGFINIGEKCDGTRLGSVITTCTSYSDFVSGTITCTGNCQLNTTGCAPKPPCSNRLIDPGEECDTDNLGFLNSSCSQYSPYFRGGTISCNSDCKLDTSNCQESPKCQNGVLDSGETCDTTNFGNLTDLGCSSYNSRFVNGTIICGSNCQISTSNCRTNATFVTCKDRGDCAINETCSDNSQCRSAFCYQNKCSEPTCSDGIKNHLESSIDCGGPCGKCPDGKTCNRDIDCISNFCSVGSLCSPQQSCFDSQLSGSESDVDCGGPCPSKCPEGKSCVDTTDCKDDLKCMSNICKKCEVNDKNCDGIPDDEEKGKQTSKDTDGDGMPDDWEIEHGLNPNDPSDANKDPDNDGLTNLQEYQVRQSVYGQSTDPNLKDTDGDGYTDKQEIDAGTNPLDSKSFPKTSKLKIILFVLGTLVLLSGFGYLGYTIITKRKEEEISFAEPRESPRILQSSQVRQVPLRSPQEIAKVKEAIKKQEKQKNLERKKLFEAFGKEEKEKPKEVHETKIEKPELKEVKAETTAKSTKRKARKLKPKKPKEDVFVKLKQIAKEAKPKKLKARKPK